MEVLSEREKRKNTLKTEKELIRRAKTDPSAFSLLYEENYQKIFSYSLKRAANIDIAKDITSETFLKALKHIGSFRWKNISFSSWLYRIASNEVVNYYRKNKYKAVSIEKIIDPISPSFADEEAIENEKILKDKKDFKKLHDKISELSDVHQQVITLHYFEKKKIKEISEIMGKKEGTVKSILHRAINKLFEKCDGTF